MVKILLVILILVTFFLLSLFIDGMMKLHRQEEDGKRNFIRDGIEGYLDQTFGYEAVKLFNTLIDANGTLIYVVYKPTYKWFKEPKYDWYEVYATDKGYEHAQIPV